MIRVDKRRSVAPTGMAYSLQLDVYLIIDDDIIVFNNIEIL